jgi:glycine/D-amino acid oxidase-like deaminating enzyme
MLAMDAKAEAELVAGAVSEPYDILIVGGGILGTATAMNLAKAGYRTIVFRLNDASCPRADTLRNQGWLQSGILYSRRDFNGDDKAYSDTVRRTFVAGYAMLSELGISPSTEQGMVRVLKNGALRAKLEERRELFRYKDFRELARNEAETRLGIVPYEDDSTYYNLPDVPFDEAGLVENLRAKAASGARFINLASAVSFSKGLRGIRVHVESTTIDPPVMLVAAGAGIAKFYSDIEQTPTIELRQTPLLVYSGESAKSMPPIFVDYERGFSSVRHDSNRIASGTALVIGTKTKENDVQYVLPENRKVSDLKINEFKDRLSDPFKALVPQGRFTAGVEVIPRGSHFLDSWIEDMGSVVLASPGRATLGWDTAVRVANMLMDKVDDGHRGHTINVTPFSPWAEQVHMHYSDRYVNLNDVDGDPNEKTSKDQ